MKKILLGVYEMKFLVPNYSCLQNPWLGGYRLQIPVLSVLCPQLNLLNSLPEKNSWVRHWPEETTGQCRAVCVPVEPLTGHIKNTNLAVKLLGRCVVCWSVEGIGCVVFICSDCTSRSNGNGFCGISSHRRRWQRESVLMWNACPVKTSSLQV